MLSKMSNFKKITRHENRKSTAYTKWEKKQKTEAALQGAQMSPVSLAKILNQLL